MTILEQIARAHRFEPRSMLDLFAFRLAQRLEEPALARHYAELAAQYGRDRLLGIYRQTVGRPTADSPAKRFHVLLAGRDGRAPALESVRLIAFKVERRSIADAIFLGDHLDFTDVRHLSSVESRAIATAQGFLNWLMASFRVSSAALEVISNDGQLRRTSLNTAVLSMCRSAGLPVWQIEKKDLLSGFRHPPTRSRTELRQVALSIWPALELTGSAQAIDAAAVGGFVQTERFFVINSETT